MPTSTSDLFVTTGLLTPEQFDKSRILSGQSRISVADAAIKLGFTTEEKVAMVLSKQYGIPYASRENKILKTEKGEGLEKMVPEKFARENVLLPLFQECIFLAVVTHQQ